MTLFDNGSATALGTATVGSDGTWSTNVTLSGNGSHSIVAKDTDAAGNTGTSSAVVYSLTVTPNGWANPNGGNWNVAANWSSGAVPLSTADVSINPIGTAPYVVTILPGTAVSANSLTLDDPDVTLLDEGTLTIAASLLMTAGALEIENGGTLSLAEPFAYRRFCRDRRQSDPGNFARFYRNSQRDLDRGRRGDHRR